MCWKRRLPSGLGREIETLKDLDPILRSPRNFSANSAVKCFVTRWLFDYPALRSLNKPYPQVDGVAAIRFRLKPLQPLRGVQLRSQQNLVSVMNLRDTFFGKSTPLKPNFVHKISVRLPRGRS